MSRYMSLIYFWNFRQKIYWPIVFSKIFYSWFPDLKIRITLAVLSVRENTRTNTIINDWHNACSFLWSLCFIIFGTISAKPVDFFMSSFSIIFFTSNGVLSAKSNSLPKSSESYIDSKAEMFFLKKNIHYSKC